MWRQMTSPAFRPQMNEYLTRFDTAEHEYTGIEAAAEEGSY